MSGWGLSGLLDAMQWVLGWHGSLSVYLLLQPLALEQCCGLSLHGCAHPCGHQQPTTLLLLWNMLASLSDAQITQCCRRCW